MLCPTGRITAIGLALAPLNNSTLTMSILAVETVILHRDVCKSIVNYQQMYFTTQYRSLVPHLSTCITRQHLKDCLVGNLLFTLPKETSSEILCFILHEKNT